MRNFLLPVWAWLKLHKPRTGEALSARMCIASSRLALGVLARVEPGWRLAAGDPADAPDGQGGMRGTNGVWAMHYWLAREGAPTPLRLDLTGDQFGHEPIIVTVGDDPRYIETADPEWRDRNAEACCDWPRNWLWLWDKAGERPLSIEEIDAIMYRHFDAFPRPPAIDPPGGIDWDD